MKRFRSNSPEPSFETSALASGALEVVLQHLMVSQKYLHWNLQALEESLPNLRERIVSAYLKYPISPHRNEEEERKQRMSREELMGKLTEESHYLMIEDAEKKKEDMREIRRDMSVYYLLQKLR
jgi:hypothetical protein